MTITITKFKLAVSIIAIALLGASAAMATHTFSDVEDGQFYTEPVEWLADNGLTTGSPSGSDTFKPFDNVTRAEYATFNYRYDQNIVQPALDDLNDAVAALPDVYFIEVSADGTKRRGSFGTSATRSSTGFYDITWPLDVDECVWQGTIAQKSTSLIAEADDGEISLQNEWIFTDIFEVDPDVIEVETRDSSGTLANRPFMVTVTCGLPTGIFVPPIFVPDILLGEEG